MKAVLSLFVICLLVGCGNPPLSTNIPANHPSEAVQPTRVFPTAQPSKTPAPSATATITPLPTRTAAPTTTPLPVEPGEKLVVGVYLAYWDRSQNTVCLSSPDEQLNVRLFSIENPQAAPRLSPDGNQIAFLDGGLLQTYDLSARNMQSVPQPSIIDMGPFYAFSGPEWSANGNMLAYAVSTVKIDGEEALIDEFLSIWITSLGDNAAYPITDWIYVETEPAWSPDGKWLAFAADESKMVFTDGVFVGSTEIYVLDTQCLKEPETCLSASRQITDWGRLGASSSPIWSPNSKHIAFICSATENQGESELYQTDICIVDVDGSNLRNLTNTPDAHEKAISWSPNGEYIAYSRSSPESGWANDIFVLSVADRNSANITNSPDDEGAPVWSPDGEWLAFSREGDVYIMPLDGGGAVNFTNTSAGDEIPLFWLVVH
ncbi:MAG: hypothetical protein GY805_35050 [Chloroflexi bacterium]|nr:hypothetical protein [Chloroflexota bacterium]